MRHRKPIKATITVRMPQELYNAVKEEFEKERQKAGFPIGFNYFIEQLLKRGIEIYEKENQK